MKQPLSRIFLKITFGRAFFFIPVRIVSVAAQYNFLPNPRIIEINILRPVEILASDFLAEVQNLH